GIQCIDRTLAQRELQAGPDLGRVVFATVAVALDHDRHLQLGALIGREAPVTGSTAPAPANLIAFFRRPGLDDLGVDVPAERALQDANPYKSDTMTDIFGAGIWVSAPVDRKLPRQLVD